MNTVLIFVNWVVLEKKLIFMDVLQLEMQH